jgi:hypothetical protein
VEERTQEGKRRAVLEMVAEVCDATGTLCLSGQQTVLVIPRNALSEGPGFFLSLPDHVIH